MENTCSDEKCNKLIKSRGMCGNHYEQWRRRNRGLVTPRRGIWDNADGTRMSCSIPDCPYTVLNSGLCSKHYGQAYYEANKGREKATKKRKRRDITGKPLDLRCEFPGCGRPEFNPGLCAGHYYQGLRGEELRPLHEKSRCPVNGCTGEFSVKLSKRGLCPRCSGACTRFSLTPESLIRLFELRVCANPGCGATRNLHIDHDHSCCPTRTSCGECVRGLLCRDCNVSLGNLREDPRRIEGLAAYLREFKQ